MDRQPAGQDGPKAVKMLEDNLARAPDGVASPAGRKRLPTLRRELADPLQGLRQETDGYRALYHLLPSANAKLSGPNCPLSGSQRSRPRCLLLDR